MNRIREGYVLVRNPYRMEQVTRYEINPEVVDLIAFCTKNPFPMMPYMEKLKDYGQYWFVTITSYGKDLEPNVPAKADVIRYFQELSNIVGINSMGWRYDPVLVSEKYTIDYHISAFEKIAKQLSGYTETCIISFIDLYEKVKQNAPEIRAITANEQITIAKAFAEIGRTYGITIKGCHENGKLVKYGIDMSGCLNQTVYEKASGISLNLPKKKSQRECNCFWHMLGKEVIRGNIDRVHLADGLGGNGLDLVDVRDRILIHGQAKRLQRLTGKARLQDGVILGGAVQDAHRLGLRYKLHKQIGLLGDRVHIGCAGNVAAGNLIALHKAGLDKVGDSRGKDGDLRRGLRSRLRGRRGNGKDQIDLIVDKLRSDGRAVRNLTLRVLHINVVLAEARRNQRVDEALTGCVERGVLGELDDADLEISGAAFVTGGFVVRGVVRFGRSGAGGIGRRSGRAAACAAAGGEAQQHHSQQANCK